MAAIQAARSGAKVTLLEKNRQVGKKILVTGNGRCNLTNTDQDLSHYRGGEPGFAGTVFQGFGLKETLEFFDGLGIFVKDRNGYLYPYSDQASSVAEVLRMEAERLGVRLALGNLCGPDRGLDLRGRRLCPGGRLRRRPGHRLRRQRLRSGSGLRPPGDQAAAGPGAASLQGAFF